MSETYMGLPLTDPKVIGILAYQWGIPAESVSEQARPGYEEAWNNDPLHHNIAERNAGRSLMTLQEALGLTEEEVLELCSNGLQLAGYLEEKYERLDDEPGYYESTQPYLY